MNKIDLPPSTTQREYMTTEGLALTTDVFNQMAENASVRLPSRLPAQLNYSSSLRAPSYGFHAANSNPAVDSLYAVSKALQTPFRESSRSPHFDWQYGVSKADRTNSRFTLDGGLADLDFTWHFAPALASVVVHEFVAADKLTPEQHEQMTLTDWANVIGTGWFSRLCHAMAFTANSAYGGYGLAQKDYAPGALSKEAPSWDKDVTEPFIIGEEFEPEDQKRYITASLSPGAKQMLRKLLNPPDQSKEQRKDGSPGCPAARNATTFPRHMVTTDPHVRQLFNRREIEIDESHSTDEKVRVFQQYTSIDRGLIVFADKLEQYQHFYGQPQVIRNSNLRVVHADVPPVDALRYPADE